MQIALTHIVASIIAQCELSFRDREKINHKRAVRQHQKYCDMLSNLGLRIVELTVNRNYPDSTFIEDTAVVVDADLKSITDEWVKSLAEPILRGYDMATPLYSRHKYDGTITNNIVYPLIVGLLSKNVRQPIGGDFSFSSHLAEYWLKQEWNETIRQFGIDIFMTTHALLGGFQVCSACLGAKIHKVKDPSESLGPMFKQVIGTLFNILNSYKDSLSSNSPSNNASNNSIEELKVFGCNEMQEPPSISINTENLRKAFNEGRVKKLHLWKKYLSEETLNEFKNIKLEIEEIKPKLWAKTLYDLLVAYPNAGNKEELLEAIQPLYFGRVYSFAKHSAGMSHAEAEAEIQEQAKAFHKLREYALKRLIGTPVTQVAE